MTVRILIGDCRVVMAKMDAKSIDAIVTDPPYGLEFMGKEWDRLVSPARGKTAGLQHEPTIVTRDDTPHHRMSVRQPAALKRCANCGGNSSGAWNRCQCESPSFRSRSDLSEGMQDWHEAWATEAFRVLKPGGHLLAFGGTRTHHRLMVAIEDAGFEIRDCLMWLYGSGFPKSLDVSKAIDKATGIEREDKFEGSFERRAGPTGNKRCDVCGKWLVSSNPCQCPRPQDAPQSVLAQQWDGWGTALKPAWEPIILARKPLTGTVAANVTAYGTGALNVDGCRIDLDGDYKSQPNGRPSLTSLGDNYDPMKANKADTVGRWPANVVLDEDAAALLDAQSGERKAGSAKTGLEPKAAAFSGNLYGDAAVNGQAFEGYGDTGGASRFYYCAKASRRERGFGNTHPTVKPIALMRWLCRLVTPAGGTVLDPFMGSGSTLIAAEREGFNAVGIELDPEYAEIARRRITGDCPLFVEVA